MEYLGNELELFKLAKIGKDILSGKKFQGKFIIVRS